MIEGSRKNDITIMYLIHINLIDNVVVVATTYHNDKWPHKAVNLLRWDIKWGIHKRTQQGASS